MEQYVITKKIAKQGKHAVIIIPTYLNGRIKAGSLAKITIDIIK